ncbi:MAG: hypothetical protein HKO04_15305 [Silicimonas sp.]|nr:hypothetical protein [Silicimonas sp.]
MKLLTTSESLDPLIGKSLAAEETRPRCVPHEDGALVIFRGVNTEPGASPEDMVSVRVWADATKVITYQQRRLEVVTQLASEVEDNKGPKSPGDFLVSLADRLTDRMQEVVDAIDSQLDEIEVRQSNGLVPPIREAITQVRRKIVVLRRFIAPQRDALDVLVAEKFTGFISDILLLKPGHWR